MLSFESTSSPSFEGIVGQSSALRSVLRKVANVASVDTTVLLTGETGTGKELIARAIHLASQRKDRALVAVNCGAIAHGVVESELFGHEKGAFTGALQRRIGRFEMADRGTLFMDEVGELNLETQVKLLRVLQEQEFERVGAARSQKVDVRVVAATNRDLDAEVAAGRFRSDLFYRLNVFPVRIPPLRERVADIELLVQHFLAQFQRKFAKPLKAVTPEGLARLQAHKWPGNIRELQNVLERSCVIATGPVVDIVMAESAPVAPAEGSWRNTGEWRLHTSARASVPARVTEITGPAHDEVVTLDDNERAHIRRAVRMANGRIHGPEGAARMLGINPSTLRSRMQKLGLMTKAS